MPLTTKLEKLAGYSRFSLKSMAPVRRNGETVYINISTITPSRRLLQIVSQFLYCGYACYLDIPFGCYIHSDISGRTATLLKGVYQAKRSAQYDIAVSDSHETLAAIDAPFKIFFNLHIFKILGAGAVEQKDFFYPITLYRKFLFPAIESAVLQKARQNSERKIAALFIGNVDADYNNEMTKRLFGINTRYEAFTAAREIPQDMLYIPHSLNDFLRDIKAGRLIHKTVLLNINDFNIPSSLWFDILLEANFFIHLCGYIQPYCHNHIESMMAGCVPITQFNRFFIPHFEHGKNALLFDTLDELKALLQGAASGDYDADAMREKTLAYYQAHYSFQSFKNKLTQLLAEGLKETAYHIATGEEWILTELEAGSEN